VRDTLDRRSKHAQGLQSRADELNKQGVELRTKEPGSTAPLRSQVFSCCFHVEAVDFTGPARYDYRWCGQRHFLAWHDLVLTDGEAKLEALAVSNAHDLRDTLTFVPPGCEITGWSALAPRHSGYTALSFEPDLVEQELETRATSDAFEPLLYFRDAALAATLRKVGASLRRCEPPDMGYLEALCLVAAFELHRLQHGPLPDMRASGRLTSQQERLVCDFIAQNLARDLTLGELASLVGLSRFHFARIFKATFGQSTRQYLSRQRIERASALLTTTRMPVASIATTVGFGGMARFATAFRQHTGHTPSQFRRGTS
jgi:AraC family transcriptional regulator